MSYHIHSDLSTQKSGYPLNWKYPPPIMCKLIGYIISSTRKSLSYRINLISYPCNVRTRHPLLNRCSHNYLSLCSRKPIPTILSCLITPTQTLCEDSYGVLLLLIDLSYLISCFAVYHSKASLSRSFLIF